MKTGIITLMEAEIGRIAFACALTLNGSQNRIKGSNISLGCEPPRLHGNREIQMRISPEL